MIESFQSVNQEFPSFFAISAFIMGAIVGSFLNVCIYRIPAKKSIIHPGSTCACGKPIAWYDNIPILSWFILRGKARCCGQPYSFRYPFIELLTGLLFLGVWITHPPLVALCLMVFVSMLVTGSFIDFDHMEIPDRFSIGLAAIGVLISILVPALHAHSPYAPGPNAIKAGITSMLGLLVGSGTILWIAILAEKLLKKEAMGFGDVKLMGGIGAFLGWEGALFAIFGGAALGCVGLLIWTIVSKILNLRKKSDEEESLIGQQIPFGPMLSGGAIVYLIFLESAVNAYFHEFAEIIW